ncbi:hypothetical protein GMOD_00004233 [Pyrenophora seminiperda CCB06]|uniref:Uncharacterized protein n=1 Tax=Pyrenophora seminiperda CCB06 TaxID=1302712 RepID=A0A3M7M0T4_9PLEO|nr:hypothetical protein GMOD_00004233 [Pyrenophora seminiperda CCB06]
MIWQRSPYAKFVRMLSLEFGGVGITFALCHCRVRCVFRETKWKEQILRRWRWTSFLDGVPQTILGWQACHPGANVHVLIERYDKRVGESANVHRCVAEASVQPYLRQ